MIYTTLPFFVPLSCPSLFPPAPRLSWTPGRDKARKVGKPQTPDVRMPGSPHRSFVLAEARAVTQVTYLASGVSSAGGGQRCSPSSPPALSTPAAAGAGGLPATRHTPRRPRPARPPPGWELAPAHHTSAPKPAWVPRQDYRVPRLAGQASPPPAPPRIAPASRLPARLPGPALGAARPGAAGQQRQRCAWGSGWKTRSGAQPPPTCLLRARRAGRSGDGNTRTGSGVGVGGGSRWRRRLVCRLPGWCLPPPRGRRCGEVPEPQARLQHCHAAGRKSSVTAASSPRRDGERRRSGSGPPYLHFSHQNRFFL